MSNNYHLVESLTGESTEQSWKSGKPFLFLFSKKSAKLVYYGMETNVTLIIFQFSKITQCLHEESHQVYLIRFSKITTNNSQFKDNSVLLGHPLIIYDFSKMQGKTLWNLT